MREMEHFMMNEIYTNTGNSPQNSMFGMLEIMTADLLRGQATTLEQGTGVAPVMMSFSHLG